MAERKCDIIIIEDDKSVARLVIRYLEDEFLSAKHFDNAMAGLAYALQEVPKVIILDLNLPDMSGMDVLKEIHNNQLTSDVIIITGHGNVNVAVKAMQYGCFDFLEKPFNGERLLVSIKNALEHNRLRQIEEEFEELRRGNFQSFIGESNAMQTVYKIIENAAPSKASIFILGESGTGKELCAEAVHDLSDRKNATFVPLNCAAIPADLVESEVFGHVKGAFTGATSHRDGAVCRADGGTLFLDEIAEMSFDVQAKFLRFLQTGQYQKVGSNKLETVNVRIICATNRKPATEIKAGRFREDLYYRLNVIPISLPPLRDRERDVILIARHFLKVFSHEENKNFSSFDTDVEMLFMSYTWPGNVRQLQNTIRNIVVLNTGTSVEMDMLPDAILISSERIISSTSTEVPEAGISNYSETSNQVVPSDQLATKKTFPDIKPLWVIERDAIIEAIEICGGSIPKAAAMLDVSPSTIYRKKQQWDNKQ